MKMDNKTRYIIINKIIVRAKKVGLEVDRMTSFIDLDFCVDKYNLDVKGLLNADDFNFIHDFCGIRDNLDRRNKTLVDFLPRFSRDMGE